MFIFAGKTHHIYFTKQKQKLHGSNVCAKVFYEFLELEFNQDLKYKIDARAMTKGDSLVKKR